MYAKTLSPTLDTTYLISRLFYEKHIYNAMDDEMRDVWVCHRTLQEIENGSRLCIGVFSKKDDTFLGCAHGMIYLYDMEAHLLLKRKVNGVTAVNLCMEEILKYYKQQKLPLKSFSATVADNNRAVKTTLRKAGFIDHGIVKNEKFISHGVVIPCRFFRKEII